LLGAGGFKNRKGSSEWRRQDDETKIKYDTGPKGNETQEISKGELKTTWWGLG